MVDIFAPPMKTGSTPARLPRNVAIIPASEPGVGTEMKKPRFLEVLLEPTSGLEPLTC
jgi:hypothetical protein